MKRSFRYPLHVTVNAADRFEHGSTRESGWCAAKSASIAGSRALYATDGSNYRQVPIGLVVPRDADDVSGRGGRVPALRRARAAAGRRHEPRRPVLQRRRRARFHEVHEPDSRDRSGATVRARPARLVLDSLRNAAEAHQLTFGPDPSTHSRCTLGGMIGNNSCGTHSLLAGKTVDNVEELHILLYDGTELTVGPTTDAEFDAIVRAGRPPRRDLRARFATCAISMRTGSAHASRAFPGVCPATTSTNCCPSTASMSRARWSAAKARCADRPRGEAQAD